MASKTVRRDWLKRQIEAGNVEAKCIHRFTDDYQFDNANDFGKTDWMPARIRNPRFEDFELPNGSVISRCMDDDFVSGQMNFMDYQFKGKSGGASRNVETDEIRFYSHSNESYDLRLKA